MLGYDPRREGWKSSVAVEEERYAKARGRDRECWDVIHDMDIEEMVKHVHRFENDGPRLGVSARPKEKVFVTNEGEDGTAQVTVQGQCSTLNAGCSIAYTELIAGSVYVATRYGTYELAE